MTGKPANDRTPGLRARAALHIHPHYHARALRATQTKASIMRRAAILLVLTAGLAGGCSDKPSAQDLQDRISELESENSNLQQQLDESHSQAATQSEAAPSSGLAAQEPPDQADDQHAGDGDGDAAYGNDDAGRAANRAADAANEAAAAASGA